MAMRVVFAASIVLASLFAAVPARAGVTGNITGLVREPDGAPVAGMRVSAVSASATRIATTDAAGQFVILTLPPDTYTLALSKPGYQDAVFAGVTVFADQTHAV